MKLSRKCSSQKKTILNLKRKSNNTQVELDLIKNSACNNCSSLESKIVELKQVIVKFEKDKIDVENVLSSKNVSNDKCGLDFTNLYNPSTSQTIFVNPTNKYNNEESKKEHVVNDHKRPYKRNHIFRPTCFYCKAKCHTTNAYYIRNYGIPYNEYVWVWKVSNPKGPKKNWVPRCN